MRRVEAIKEHGRTLVDLRASRNVLFLLGGIGAGSAVMGTYALLSENQSNAAGTLYLAGALFMAYMTYYANERFLVGSHGLAWRATWGFSWNVVSAGDISQMTLSRGNLLNHPIVVLELNDGRTMYAPMPGIEPDERDRAYEALRKVVSNAKNQA